MPKTAVIILNWNGEKYLPDCLGSLMKQDYPKENREFILVDNGSEDDSLKYCQENFSEITVIKNEKNFGFCKGNNIGMRYALDKNYDYVVLLNQDSSVEPNWLSELVKAAESGSQIGGVQSLMLYYGDKRKINSFGNHLHFLGFGFCDGNNRTLDDFSPRLGAHKEITYASCASVLFRASILQQVGLLDEEYFLYHEDTDLSFRIKMAGYKVVMAPKSVMYHKYEFSRSITKYYYMERNRYRILLEYFKWPTLILNLPAFIAMEGGMWFFALKSGWAKEKWRAYKYIFHKTNLKDIFRKRRKIQAERKINDKEFTKSFVGEIMYQEIDNPLLRYIGNPVLKFYWGLVRRMIYW